jgi:hypothetical protein
MVHTYSAANPSNVVRILAISVLILSARIASAQESSGDEQVKATRVALGSVSGAVNAQVMVPVFVTPYPSGASVGSVTATIEYANKGITFVKAEKSFLLDGVNGGIQVQNEKDAKNPAKSIMHLEVATKGEPRKPLREGLLVTLLFRLEPDAPAGTKVDLTLTSAAATNLESKPVQPLVSKSGSIEVLKPENTPYVGCFFFTH